MITTNDPLVLAKGIAGRLLMLMNTRNKCHNTTKRKVLKGKIEELMTLAELMGHFFYKDKDYVNRRKFYTTCGVKLKNE